MEVTSCVVSALFFLHCTNPDISLFPKAWEDLWSYAKSSLFGVESPTDWFLFSIFRKTKASYYIGVAGFWISPSYWSSFYGSLLIALNVIRAIRLLMNSLKWTRYNFHPRPEDIIYNIVAALQTTLLYIFFSMQQETSEKETRLLFVVCIGLALYIFQIMSKSPWMTIDNVLYGLASAMVTYVATTHHSTTFSWNGVDCSYPQFTLGMLTIQLLLGHSFGLVGGIAGLLHAMFTK